MDDLAQKLNHDIGAQDKLVASLPVEIEAILGRTRITVGELNSLRPGDFVKLAQPLNQNVELRVNNIVIARGEIVAVDDKFGIRITEMIAAG